MKTMLQKIQTLGQKAAQLKHVVESAPARVAQVRQSIQLTAGELQKVRMELQEVATGLHVENDEDFTVALREISESAEVFREAGYDLAGIDVEVSHSQRIMVHLLRIASVPEPDLRHIMNEHHSRVTVASILSSMIKAEALAERVSVPNMEYTELAVHLGPSPAVRLCWREVVTQEIAPASVGAPVVALPPALPPTSSFAQSNFFEASSRTAHVVPDLPAPVHMAAEVEESPSGFSSSKSLQGDWKKEALDRLKNSPGVSKYRR